jgi:hypothetical protein
MDDQKSSRIRVRKDPKHRAIGTKTHTPRVDYDRRDRSWVDEQDAEYQLEEQQEQEKVKHDD